MGCDIYLFIEHKEVQDINWNCFGKQISPGRNYELFAKMANVRNYNTKTSLLPKGLPEDISWVVNDENTLYIDDDMKKCDSYCTKEEAERWVKYKISQYAGEFRVTHPDWHSHSWLATKEYEKAIAGIEHISNEYKVIFTVLKAFQELGEEARIVFWFDN